MVEDCEIKNYIEYTKYWASVFEDRGKQQRTLELYEEAWRRKPEDLACHWTLLKLRCLVDETQESALQLLSEWSSDEDKFGGQSPALSMLEMAEQEEYDTQILPLARYIKNEKLREQILKVTEDALAQAGKSPVTWIHGRLFYLQGVVHAFSSDAGRQSGAIRCWESVLIDVQPDDNDPWELHFRSYRALMHIMKHKFDQLHTKLLSDKGLMETTKIAMQQNLEGYLERMNRTPNFFEEERGADSIEAFVVAFSSLAGMDEESRQLCSLGVAQAVGILSDSDPDNDSIGLRVLARIFCRLGDKAGALTAFSLLDREILQQRSLTGGEAAEEVSVEAKLSNGLNHSCDGCGRGVYSSGVGGVWWRRFCPDFDLRTDCKVKQDQGGLRIELCNPAHVSSYINLVHSKYEKDELEPKKVRVGWECKDEGNGKFSCEGGEVIDMKDWLQRLRKQWGLLELAGDVNRAQ